MTISAQSIIQTVVFDLDDPTSVHWTIDEHCRWFNDAQRDAVTRRPDITATRSTRSLSTGTVQTLPTGATGLLDVPRNASGTKRAITKVDRSILDRQIPNWHSLTGTTTIKHYCYDIKEPLEFLVYPPAASGASVEVVCTMSPTDITVQAVGGTYEDVTGNLSLPDQFAVAVQHYIKWRAYSKEGESTANPTLAAAALAAYASALGNEINAKMAAQPPAVA